MKIPFLSGSFRRKSYSQAVLDVITEETNAGIESSRFSLEILPFFSEDFTVDNRPASITDFLALIARSDGIVICTPEYNHSIPAVLKNAIDWASRPAFNSPLKAKPVTFITQASSPVGGARAQAHLKLVFDSTLSVIFPCKEFMIVNVHSKFDENLKLVDEETRSRLRLHLTEFVSWAKNQRVEVDFGL